MYFLCIPHISKSEIHFSHTWRSHFETVNNLLLDPPPLWRIREICYMVKVLLFVRVRSEKSWMVVLISITETVIYLGNYATWHGLHMLSWGLRVRSVLPRHLFSRFLHTRMMTIPFPSGSIPLLVSLFSRSVRREALSLTKVYSQTQCSNIHFSRSHLSSVDRLDSSSTENRSIITDRWKWRLHIELPAGRRDCCNTLKFSWQTCWAKPGVIENLPVTHSTKCSVQTDIMQHGMFRIAFISPSSFGTIVYLMMMYLLSLLA